jgi:hypothetical protein
MTNCRQPFRRFAILATLATMLLTAIPGLPQPALAALSSTLTISISDAQTGKPVALALVSLRGPAPFQGLTDGTGNVGFDNVPCGSYAALISKTGYLPTSIRTLTVPQAEDVKISATLSRLAKIIARVAVTSKPKPASTSVLSDGTQALVNGSTVGALQQSPLANTLLQSNGQTTLSIEGHDPSQTGLLVDGLPLAPQGALTNLASIGSDLFESVDVIESKDSSELASGGAADFQIPNPTLQFQTAGLESYSSFDSSRDSLFVRGTSGFIGYSFGHSTNGYDSVLNGKSYLDVSGFRYAHDAATLNQANVLKLRFPTSATNVVTASWLSSTYYASDFCNELSGLLPCGVGPVAGSKQTINSWQVRDAAVTGRIGLDLAIFASAIDGSDDQNSASFLGEPDPLAVSYDARSRGATLKASLFSTGPSQWSLSALTYSSDTSGNAQLLNVLNAPVNAQSTGFFSVGIQDAVNAFSKVSIATRLGVNRTTGARSALFGAIDSTWTPSSRDKLIFSASAGSLFPAVFPASGLSQVSAIQFDCSSGTAYGSAPGSNAAQPSEDAQARATFSHSQQNFDVSVEVYGQILHGALLTGYIDGSAISPGQYPQGYLDQISAYYGSSFGCNQPTKLSYEDLALRESMFGTAVYQGANGRIRYSLGHGFLLDSYYAFTGAKGTATIVGSTLNPSTQLLGVPLQKMGALLDWKTPSDSTELAVSAQHVSANSLGYLPAHTAFSTGARFGTSHGDIELSVANIFNTFGETFGSPAIGETVGRVGAAPLQLIGLPLAPRTFQVAYRFRTGATSANATSSSQDQGLATSASVSAAPLTTLGRGDPFEINRSNDQCGPESLQFVEPFFSALRSYIGSGQISPVHQLPMGIRVYYRTTGAGRSAFLIEGTRPAVNAAIIACITLHAGSVEDAQHMGLYAPTTADPHNLVNFMPSLGFYAVFNKANSVVRHATIRPLSARKISTAVNESAFKLDANATSCSTDVRPAATYILNQLQQYFAASTRTPIEGLSILSHGTSNVWYELRFDDPHEAEALRSCAVIYDVTVHDARRYGISGSADNLNFYPAIGLYVFNDLSG